MSTLNALIESLTKDIENAYETSITMEEAERLAAKFLLGQIKVSESLASADLDARMRKQGVKAIRAAVYLENATKGEKKPSDVMLEAMVNRDDLVSGEEASYIKAEVEAERLQNYLNIFKDAHIYARGVSRGRFE